MANPQADGWGREPGAVRAGEHRAFHGRSRGVGESFSGPGMEPGPWWDSGTCRSTSIDLRTNTYGARKQANRANRSVEHIHYIDIYISMTSQCTRAPTHTHTPTHMLMLYMSSNLLNRHDGGICQLSWADPRMEFCWGPETRCPQSAKQATLGFGVERTEWGNMSSRALSWSLRSPRRGCHPIRRPNRGIDAVRLFRTSTGDVAGKPAY